MLIHGTVGSIQILPDPFKSFVDLQGAGHRGLTNLVYKES